MANIFKKIGKFFKKITNQIKKITEVLKILACPINIFKNIHICAYFWFIDMLIWLLWCIVWFFCFIFIYIPIWIASLFFCTAVGSWFGFTDKNRCINYIKVNDVCPSKRHFSNGIENLNNLLSGKRFLYRNKNDIRKCYCVKPLEILFDPLKKYSSYLDKAKSQENINYVFLLSLPLGILFIIYATNK